MEPTTSQSSYRGDRLKDRLCARILRFGLRGWVRRKAREVVVELGFPHSQTLRVDDT